MSMISNAVIAGGNFSSINDHRQIHVTQTPVQKSAFDRLQESVAYTAFHNSGGRFDPPKCHANTRVAVRDKVEKWALRTNPDTKDASILWLSGAAGAGKSAIAQTMAEDFHSRGLLVASFFFGRSDPTRNHARSLVSTIVYQLYPILPPAEQSRLLAVIDFDPLIFTKSLLAQFEALIVNPLRPLYENGFWSSIDTPRLVIIDGLDECLDHGMQRNVLLMLCASVQQFHLPFIFLLASRPEHDIKAVMDTPDFHPIHSRLFLDDTYLPDRDIELFLRDQFEDCRTTHPFKHMIPDDWPSDDTLKEITKKSSGQFIYASVVAKYVKSSRHRPHYRLDVVMNLRPASRDLPFSELDALYTHIFSGVDDIERVLDVIGFHVLFFMGNVYNIECILQLDPGETEILLCDLSSVLAFRKDLQGRLELKLLHASLADYLVDSARSNEYFIDMVKHRTDRIANCFQFLSTVRFESSWDTAYTAICCFINNHLSLTPTESLYHAIREFSIPQIYDWLPHCDQGSGTDLDLIYKLVLKRFLPALFKFLHTSNSPKSLELHQHHRSEYDRLLRETMKTYVLGTPLHLFFALVAIHRRIPTGAFHRSFSLFDTSQVDRQSLAIFPLKSTYVTQNRECLEYLSNFLWDSKRSQEFCAGPKLFAQAAKYCLLYLCDHTASAQKAPPRMSSKQRLRRKHTPWKWHRRVLRKDIRGADDAPWLWLQKSTSELHSYTLCCKTNALVYAHDPNFSDLVDDDIGYEPPPYGPVVDHRIYSEKYHLALKFLNSFLPRAAKLDELVQMCQTLTLASLSQDFPRKSARARSNMHMYAVRCG